MTLLPITVSKRMIIVIIIIIAPLTLVTTVVCCESRSSRPPTAAWMTECVVRWGVGGKGRVRGVVGFVVGNTALASTPRASSASPEAVCVRLASTAVTTAISG